MGDDEPREIDELDRGIIGALNENARKSYRDLAGELDVALSTISNRVHRLEDDGIIEGYIPVVDAERVGFELTVLIGVRIAHGNLREVEELLASDERVYGVYDVTGDWDCLALARFGDREELDAFIKGIVSHEDVERTNTHLVLNTVKDEKTLPVG